MKRAPWRREGLVPTWVEPPSRPPQREPISDDQLPPAALAPHLKGILPIARRFLNAEKLAEALRPRYYGDIRNRQADAFQPVPALVPASLPDVIVDPQPAPAPIQAPLPDIIQEPRPALVLLPEEPLPAQVLREPQEPAATAAARPESTQAH